jgi:opine dehydrogenase
LNGKPRFAILGAGNGGLSMAGDLALHGFEVKAIYDRFEAAVEPVRQRHGIELVGDVMAGFAPIACATTDIAEAVDKADVVVVVVPAFAHEWIASEVAPHLQNGQIVVLTPGYPGGSLLFRKTLLANGLKAQIDLAETNLIVYATRIVGPAQVGIKAIKNTLWIAALPASRTRHVLETLQPAIPQLVPLENVLEVGFNCTNPVAHVPTAVLNWARMEQDDGTKHFDWHEWVTHGVERVKEQFDEDRGAVLRAMGVRFISYAEANRASYEGKSWQIVPLQGPIPESSRTIPPRFIEEDIPMGVVAWASMGRKLGVATPMMDALITLASAARGRDFWAEGRTPKRLGVADRSVEEILALVNAQDS